MGWIPNGVVEQVDGGYVGHCHEVGTTAQGATVEEAFANLYAVTWQALQEKGADGELVLDVPHDDPMDEIAFFPAGESDRTSAALAAMTAVILDGLGEYERLGDEQPTA